MKVLDAFNREWLTAFVGIHIYLPPHHKFVGWRTGWGRAGPQNRIVHVDCANRAVQGVAARLDSTSSVFLLCSDSCMLI
jgi:hypothetical protein